MRQSRKSQVGRWIAIVGTVSAIAIAAGAAIHYLSGPPVSDNKDSSKRKSRCVVITDSVAASKEFNWDDFLTRDIVLLVAPGIHFSQESFKVIHCDTMVGLWSCVRHLKKDQLLLEQSEINESIPVDLPRYTKEILNISCLQDD